MRFYTFLFFASLKKVILNKKLILLNIRQTIKDVACKNGAVVSAHALASEVGVSILKEGGNAIDAAIATQLALAVVYPDAGNIGGGGFMVIHLKSGENVTIDFRETGSCSSFQRYVSWTLTVMHKCTYHKNGHLSAGVPGSVAGMFALR